MLRFGLCLSSGFKNGNFEQLESGAQVTSDFRHFVFKQHRNVQHASGLRSLNCAGPETASTLRPEAPE
eukprot:8697069-Alexandrium_andersonii.AAC.1